MIKPETVAKRRQQRERREEIHRLWSGGHTFRQIGETYGICIERVRQILRRVSRENAMIENNFSIEAQVVAGCFWGRMMPRTEVSFDRPWIIHPKTRKGLDELVEAGLLTVEKFNRVSDKLVWKPTARMKTEGPKPSLAFMMANPFPITTE